MKELHKNLRETLTFISKRMVKYANKKRIERPILKEGDIVYLLRKNIKIKQLSSKLNYIKLGPFKIKET